MAYPLGNSRLRAPKPRTVTDDNTKARDCQKYLMVLADQRRPWEPMIDNIIAYVNHGRRFISDNEFWAGQQTGQEVYDDSAMLARNKLTDGLSGYLCNRSQPWFGLELPTKFNFPRTSGMRSWNGKRLDEYPQVRQWLQDTGDVLYSAFNRSNFYDILPEFISDGATCGTSHFIVEEDIARGTSVFTVPHFRECYIATNQWGKVDTNYRVYRMTLCQLQDKFGEDRMVEVDDQWKKAYEQNKYQQREILHAVYPRESYSTDASAYAKAKPWESIWIYRKGGIMDVRGSGNTAIGNDNAKVLSEGGYDSMPIITWRWRVNSDEVYGRGPAHDAFVSIATANQMGRTNLITAQKAAEPPLVAYADLRGAIQRNPDGITYVENNRGDIRQRMPQPLLTGSGQLPFTVQFQDRGRAIINEHFHTDVFMMMSQLAAQGVTERMVVEQIAELQAEKAAILSTRIGNLQSEALDPLIERMYSIEAAAGRIPEPPDVLLQSAHGPVQVQYLGPLAQAQTRLTKVRSLKTGIDLAAQMANINPTAMDVIDFDETMREMLNATGFAPSCMRDPRAILAIRDQRNKIQQAEATADQAPKLARAAASLTKSPEAGSIMAKLTGEPQEQPNQ